MQMAERYEWLVSHNMLNVSIIQDFPFKGWGLGPKIRDGSARFGKQIGWLNHRRVACGARHLSNSRGEG